MPKLSTDSPSRDHRHMGLMHRVDDQCHAVRWSPSRKTWRATIRRIISDVPSRTLTAMQKTLSAPISVERAADLARAAGSLS